MPVSLLFFAFAAVAFILQLIPQVGVFLMFLMAPFWSIALVNAGFVGVGLEAAFGKVKPVWLLLPLAWFGGYSILAAQSRQEAERVLQEILTENAKGALAFNPRTDEFVAGEGRPDIPSVADALVARYDIPAAMEKHPGNSGFAHRVYRFGAGPVCEQLTERLKGRHDTNFAVWQLRENRKPIPGVCMYFQPGEPGSRAFRMASEKKSWSRKLAEFEVTTLTVSAPSGQKVTRLYGDAKVLGWFPMPVLGCALISAVPSWSCMASFWRSAVSFPGSERAPDVVAKLIASALRLAPASPATRVAAAAPASSAHVAKTFEDVEAVALKKLDQALARDRAALDYNLHDMTPIRDKPQLWRSRMDRMADFFVENFNRREDGRIIPEVVNTLFSAMPVEDFRRYAPRLSEVVRQRPARACEDGMAVVARIGEAGALALSALEAVAARTRGRDCMYLLQSICRAGLVAERMLPFVIEAYNATGPRVASNVHEAAYRTLLRLGKADLVRARLEEARGSDRKRLEKDIAEVTPASPPSVCG